MTEPVGSEGVSWIDVAASAAGIESEMRRIGQRAASSFSQEFNRNVGPQLSRALAGSLDQALGQAFSGKLTSTFSKLSQALTGGMKSAGAAGAGEAAAAGGVMGEALTAGIAGAVALGAGLVVSDVRKVAALAGQEVGAFAKVGKDSADALMTGFADLVEGKIPDTMRVFDAMEEGARTALEVPFHTIDTAIDATVGHIPILGSAFKSAMGEAESAFGGLFSAFDEAKELASEFGQQMLDIGNEWQEAARTIAGQTIGTGQLEQYLDIVKEISASGALVHFKDVAESVGELGQRLAGLGDGAGLTTSQLTELTKTLAESDELLGNIHIDVDNLTAAFNDFNVAPENTADELTTLVNIARMTGANLNDLVADTDRVAPSMQALGYDLDQTAFMMGRLNQELGAPAMSRLAFGIGQVEDHFHKLGVDAKTGWAQVVGIVQDYLKAGDHAAAVDILKGFVGSARTAETLVDGISKGVVAIPDQVQQAISASGDALHQPLSEVLEDTRSLQDDLDQISNQLKSAFADIGLPLVEGLTRAGDHIRTWLQANQSKVIGWGAEIMTEILKVFSLVTTDIGRVLYMVSPAVNIFKSVVLGALKDVDLAMQAVIAPLTHLPGWAGGDMFREMQKDLKDATVPLNDLDKLDLTKALHGAAQGLMDIGANAAAAIGPLDKYAATAQNTAAINEAFSASFSKDGGKPEYGNAFEADKDGALKLLGTPGTWSTVAQQLGKLGIHVDYDAETGKVRKFTTATKAEADALHDYLAGKLGPDAMKDLFGQWWGPDKAPKLPVTVEQSPPLSPDQARAKLGLPSEVTVPVTPQGVPAAPGVPYTSGPQYSPQPAMPGPPIPPGSDITLPAPGQSVAPAGPKITQEGFHTTGTGLVGVVLPTSLNVHDPKQRKTLPELMDAVGVPTSAQGSDGVTLPVGFDVQNMPQLSIPMPSADGSVPSLIPPGGGGGGPSVRYAGRAGGAEGWRRTVQTVLAQYGGQLGIPEQAYPAWEDAIIRQIATESAGDPNAVNNTDSNAQAGHPSQGLLQFIASTYGAHNITGRPFPDPVGEIGATLSYAPRTPDGWPAQGLPNSIGEGHGFHDGGWVKGPLYAGRDSVPMSLPAGTFVVRRDQALKHRGALDKMLSGTGGHHGHTRTVRALVQPDERLIPPKIAAANLGKLWAINSGAKICTDPGCSNPNHLHLGGVAMQTGGRIDTYGAQVDTIGISEALDRAFPGIASFGLYRGPDGYDEHSSGEAVDVSPGGIGTPATGAALELGNQIMAAALANAQQFGVEYCIWQNRLWYPGGRSEPYGEDPSKTTLAHMDHVHIRTAGGGFPAGAGPGPGGETLPHTGTTSSVPAPAVASMLGGQSGNFSLVDNTTGPGGGGGGPGGGYGPPPGLTPAAPGAPGAISTPYGSFQYSWEPGSSAAGLPPEQRKRYDEWLRDQQRRAERSTDTNADIDRLNQRVQEAKQKATAADKALQDKQAEIDKLPADKRAQAEQLDTEYQEAKKNAAAADRAYADAQKSLADAKRRQADQGIEQHIQDETPPPWAKGSSSGKYDQNADTLGKGLVKGIFQELGFPDVFGKPPTQWGISKLLMGGAGYAMNLLQNPQLGTGTWFGGHGAAAASNGGGGILDSLIHGIGHNLLPQHAHAPQGPPGQQNRGPGGAPEGPSNLPAQARSQTPATDPKAQPAGNAGGGLHIDAPMSGVMAPDAAGKFINTVLNTTATAALAGGAGVPL